MAVNENEQSVRREAEPQGDPWRSLPPSFTLLDAAVARVQQQDLHAVCLRFDGLDVLMELFGYRAPLTLLGQVVRRLRSLLDERDHLARHSGTRLLLLTVRLPREIEEIIEKVHQTVSATSIEARGRRVPIVCVGRASLARTTDLTEIVGMIEALVLTAETAADRADGSSEMESGTHPRGEASERSEVAPEGAAKAQESEDEGLASAMAEEEEEAADQPAVPRIVLRQVSLTPAGEDVSVSVEVSYRSQRAAARVVARPAGDPQRNPQLLLVAGAAARAVELVLSPGYDLHVEDLQVIDIQTRKAVWVAASIRGPFGQDALLGTAFIHEDPHDAAARALLSAVNRRVTPLVS